MANARLDELDYYELLKIPPEASRDEVRRAFHRFAAKYHPDRYTGRGAEPALVQRAAEIYRRGAEAYRVLSHAQQRRAYDQQRAQGHRRYDPSISPPPRAAADGVSFPLKLRNPAARPFAQKAERAYKAGDWQTCQFNVKLALNKDREHPQLTALLQAVEAKLAGG